MAKDRYKISLWEDYLVPESGNVPGHYKEREIAVIGSDSMTTDCRAVEPKLVENVNGTSTLTFKMFYVYTDEHGEKYQNPFLNLLVNERKVKAFWKGKWYDFVIKNCQENSEDRSITYTCTDLFINELSKTGFDIELDTELNNNQGTAVELAQKVLEGTDWKVDVEGSQVIQQEKEEPVYEFTLGASLGAINETTGVSDITINSGSKILFFYQEIQDIIQSSANSGSSYLQFAYADNYATEANSQLVINADCYSTQNALSWTIDRSGQSPSITFTGIGTLYYNTHISDKYRASRLVKSQNCRYDPLTERYCYVYEAKADYYAPAYSPSGGDSDEEVTDKEKVISTGDTIYCYRSVEFDDVVHNLVVNSRDWVNTTEGWTDEGIEIGWYPSIEDENGKSYLKVTNVFENDIKQSSQFLDGGIFTGQKFIFRYKARINNNGKVGSRYLAKADDDYRVIPTIGPSRSNPYIERISIEDGEDNWIEWTIKCTKSVTVSQFYEQNVKLIMKVKGATTGNDLSVWLEEAQLFPLVYGEIPGSGGLRRIEPNILDSLSISQTSYTYYNFTKSQGLANVDNLNYLYRDTIEWNPVSGSTPVLKPVYNDNFEKIRSITVKQSNRFNILQTIAETFECWIDFEIEHESNGCTVYDSEGCPQKHVRIKKDLGREVGVGFVYGIDLKSIQRTIQSDQIVTKTIVSPNANEHATNGFCTIARSEENYPRTNFILNFDYYITQGLLNGGELNKDLYLTTPDVIGYYYNLNRLNKQYDELNDTLTQRKTELTKQRGYKTVYETSVSQYYTERNDRISELKSLVGTPTEPASWTKVKNYVGGTNGQNDAKIQALWKTYKELDSNYTHYNDLLASINSSISALETYISNQDTLRKSIVDELNALNLKFYKKYSRYIQEGSWTSEDYIDDNLYYLDALSVAYTSSRPQVSYTISVLRLSYLEEFKNKVFHLGDISFIQDTEFFGYTFINGIKTPYKEKVLVSEIVSNFDDPSQDTITVQNYKTQFEDLFQRITSTTQSLQYASGEYARAASVVETNGTINPQTLQASFAFNEQLVISAQNEHVITDATGITVTDATDPNKKTKVTSGGIIFTVDGGATWTSAVTGGGLNTQALTAGTMYSDRIAILDGQFTSFRWDEKGINAYVPNSTVSSDSEASYNLSHYVRFDHFGIYGLKEPALPEGQTYEPPQTEDDVFRDASFGMTWNRFFMKNQYGDHLVEISSDNDIRILYTGNSSSVDVIKIGKLENGLYGLRLKDNQGNITLRTASDGTLWLDNKLSVARSTDSYIVELGSLGVASGESAQRVIYAGTSNSSREFIVYEDGSIKATAGQIGNLTIDQIQTGIEEAAKGAYKVVISAPSNGTVFVDSNPINLTASLYQGDSQVSGNMSYRWYRNGVLISGATSSTISAIASPPDISTYVYTCEITYPV